MADIQSNIQVNIDTSEALASIKLLQKQISAFHTTMAKSGAAASLASSNLQQNLINSLNSTGKFAAEMRTIKTSTESFTTALEKNKLSMRDYFRYAGASTKTFGRLFASEFDTVNKVARERVKDLQTQYIKMGRDANGAMKAIAVRPLALDMKDLGTQTAIAAQRQQLLNQLLKQGSTNLLNFGKNTQWAGRQLMVGFTVPLMMFGTQASKTFMQLEEQAIRFKRVYGEMFTTSAETDKMLTDVKLLAKEFTKYGVAVESTMKMAADAAAQGKMGADLLAQVNQATRLAVLGGVDQQQALDTTISLTNAFGISADQLSKKINFLNAVENQTVVSIEDLTTAIPKAGPVVQQLGGSVEDLAFFLTAMKEGGINASEGANALKSGLASLINPTAKASNMLAGFGINIKGIVEANKGDIKGIVVGFAQALNTLDPLNRARAIEQLFGKFQFARLSTLFQNVTQEGTQASRVLKLTQATTEELAILSERELKRVEDSPMYKFKKVVEDLKVTIAPIGAEFLKAVTPIVEFIGKVLDKFNGLSDGAKNFTVILTTLLAGIGPVALMTFGLLANGVANIIKLFTSVKSVFNRTGLATNDLGSQTSYMTQEQLRAASVAASLDQVHNKLTQSFTSEANAINQLVIAYQRAIAAQKAFIPGAGGIVPGKGPKKFNKGTVGVRYYAQGTDSVPAMLTPGEAVIPAGPAQNPANKPAIKYMVAGGVLSQFAVGTTGAGDFSHIGGYRTVGALDLATLMKQLPAGIVSTRTMQVIEQAALKFANTLKINLYGKLGIDTGVSSRLDAKGKPVTMNNLMKPGGAGVAKNEFMADWDKRGLARWKKSLGYAGLKMQDVSEDLTLLDSGMKEYLTKLDQNTNITDVHIKEAYDFAKKKVAVDSKLITSFEQLAVTAGEARVNVSQAAAKAANLPMAPGGGKKGARLLGNMKIRLGGDRFTFYKKQGIDISNMAEAGVVQGMKEAAQIASPSKKTKIVGQQIAQGAVLGLNDGIDDAKVAGQKIGVTLADSAVAAAQAAHRAQTSRMLAVSGVPVDRIKAAQAKFNSMSAAEQNALLASRTGTSKPSAIDKAIRRQQEKQAKLAKLAEKQAYRKAQIAGMVASGAGAGQGNNNSGNGGKGGFFGRFRRTPGPEGTPRQGMGAGGAMMAASGVMMAASMAPGKVGETAQKLMMPMMALTMILPMLQSKIGALTVGLGLLAYSVISSKMAFDKAQDAAMKFTEAIGSGETAIRDLSKFAGTVSAGEIMDRRRKGGLTPFAIQTGKTTFGESFVQNDTGKNMLAGVANAIKTQGRGAAGSQLVNQLATAMASGTISAAQARSIVASIGEKLGDYGFSLNVNAQLMSLVGVNGENLLKDPITIRVKLLEDTRNKMNTSTANARKAGGWTAKDLGKTAAFSVGAGVLGAGAGAIAGGALAGAATAAGIGATVGSVVPVVGTIIGAAIGLGVGTFLARKDRNKRIGEASGASVAMQKIALEQQQEMLDSLDLEYQKKIDTAKAAGNQAEAERLTNEYLAGRQKLLDQNAKTVTAIANSYTKSKGATRDALMTGVDKAITAKYKGTALADVVPLAQTQINDSKLSGEKKYTLKMQLAAGNIDPMQMVQIFEVFGNDTKSVDKIINIITKFGGTTANQAMSVAGMFTDKNGNPVKSTQTKFIATVETAKTSEEANKLIEFYAKVAATGNVLNTSVIVDLLLKNPTLAKELQDKLDVLSGLKGGIIIPILTKILNKKELDVLNDDLTYFDSLKDEQKKIYLQTLVTTLSTVSPDDPALKNWLAGDGSAYKDSPPGTQLQEYAQWNAQRVTVTSPEALQTKSNTPDAGAGTKVQSSVLDDLTKKLRDVRKLQVQVTEGWSASMKALNNLFGGNKAITEFNGLEQSMRRMGLGQNMIELIVGMDPKEYEKQKGKLFEFDNKKNIIALKQDALTIQKALNSIVLGDFQSNLEKQRIELADQNNALVKLSQLGVPVANAYELLSDKTLATAIANETNSKSLERLISQYKKLTAEQKKQQTIQNIKTDIASSQLDAIQQDRIQRNYSVEDAFAITTDANLKAMEQAMNDAQLKLEALMRNGADKELIVSAQNQLNQLITDFNTRLNQLKSTIDYMQGMFDDGYNKAMDWFSAQETQIDIQFQFKTKADQDIIQKAQDEIAGINYQIDDWQANLKGVEDQEKVVNETYDARIKALDTISQINQAILQQQKSQLTIADALSQGDIGAAARAIQDARAQAAQNAMDSQKAALEQGRQSALAGLTSNGFTRVQIEAKIQELQDQIFKIEEARLEPAQERVRLAEIDKRNAIESLRLLGLSKLEWENIKNGIDLARTGSLQYLAAMQAALDIVTKIKDYWKELDGKTYTTYHKVITVNETAAETAAYGQALVAAANAAAETAPTEEEQALIDAENAALEAANQAIAESINAAMEEAAAANAANAAALVAKLATNAATSTSAVVKQQAQYAAQALGWASRGTQAGMSTGGLVPKYFAVGGFARGTDTVPAMLTPGEFVVRKYAVDNFGVDKLKAINTGNYDGGSVYNYDLTVNVRSESNPDEIARTVMAQIKQVDSKRLGGNRL